MTNKQKVDHGYAAQSSIQGILHRYCHAIDRMQFEELKMVFHEDAIIRNGANQLTRAQFIDNVSHRHPTVATAFHMLGNISIELIDERRAFAQSYCLAFERHANSEQAVIERTVRVRYGDLFERREGFWKISQRRLVIDHEQAIPARVTQPPMFYNAQNAGTRNADDAIIEMRNTLITST